MAVSPSSTDVDRAGHTVIARGYDGCVYETFLSRHATHSALGSLHMRSDFQSADAHQLELEAPSLLLRTLSGVGFAADGHLQSTVCNPLDLPLIEMCDSRHIPFAQLDVQRPILNAY